MIIFTVQPNIVYKEILEKGIYYDKEEFTNRPRTGDEEKHRIASTLLKKYVSTPNKAHSLMWAFYCVENKKNNLLKEDLKFKFKNYEPYNHLYKLNIPNKNVLLIQDLYIDSKKRIITKNFNENGVIEAVFWEIKEEYIEEIYDLKTGEKIK